MTEQTHSAQPDPAADGRPRDRPFDPLSAALDATSDAVGVYRPVLGDDGRFADAEIVLINRSGRERWFPGMSADDLRGGRLFAIRPSVRPLLFDIYQRVADGGEAVREARTFDTARGRRVIDVSVEPFPGGFIHVGRDVTEERASRDALRASEDRLRRMVEGIDAVVTYQEPGGGLPTLSPQVERLLGYRPEDVAPYGVWESLVHPDDLPRCRVAWADPSDRWDIEYRVRHADGRWLWIADRGNRFRDGRGVGAQGMLMDISREREAAARFRAVFEENPQAIALLRPVWGADGSFADAEVVVANRTARDGFAALSDGRRGELGLAGPRLFGRPGAGAGADHALFGPARDACVTGQTWQGEVEVHSTGGSRWYHVSVFPYEFGFALVGSDVTVERAAEMALLDSESRYRAVTESAADAIVTVDSRGVIADANPSAARVFGLPVESLVGGPLVRVVPMAHRAAHRDRMAAFLSGEWGTPSSVATRVVALRADGTEFAAEITLSAWERGGERYATAFLRDVTDRERAERAAQVATGRLRHLLDANMFGMLVAEPGGRVVEANDYWLGLTGWTRDEVDRGEADWRLVTPADSIAADERAIAEIRDHGRSSPFEKVYARRDGTRVPVLVVRTAMPGGDGLVASVALDMSPLRAASDRAAKLAAAIEQTTEAVVITDPDARITYVNPAFEHVSGYAASEAVGENPRILNSGEQDAAFYERMWTTLVRGETWRGEFVNRRKDGSRYRELATISPIRSADGETVAYVAVKRDVTLEREAEAERRQGQRLEALGQLAGGVAHDFNNLLAAIRGYADFVREALAPGTQARSDMDELLRAVDRAGSLTRQLLVFTRRQPVARARIDPAVVIDGAAGLLRHLLGEQVELRADLPPGLGHVLADPAQLEQAVVNLALNARDAMPDGGVLEVGVERLGDLLRLRVRDTGAGMDEATLARIYEPFFTTKGPGRGTGLGLSMVYGFVRAAGGAIRVTSAPGKGTSFVIDLPAVPAAMAAPADPLVQVPIGGTEAVLLVEDEPTTRDVARRYLEGLGYLVRTAGSAREALEMLASGPTPDLLLADVRMPGMQGPELVRVARATWPGLRAALMSGFADAFDAGDAAIAAAVLEKPFTRESLAGAVRAALER